MKKIGARLRMHVAAKLSSMAEDVSDEKLVVLDEAQAYHKKLAKPKASKRFASA